jgi:hypothetical protein
MENRSQLSDAISQSLYQLSEEQNKNVNETVDYFVKILADQVRTMLLEKHFDSKQYAYVKKHIESIISSHLLNKYKVEDKKLLEITKNKVFARLGLISKEYPQKKIGENLIGRTKDPRYTEVRSMPRTMENFKKQETEWVDVYKYFALFGISPLPDKDEKDNYFFVELGEAQKNRIREIFKEKFSVDHELSNGEIETIYNEAKKIFLKNTQPEQITEKLQEEPETDDKTTAKKAQGGKTVDDTNDKKTKVKKAKLTEAAATTTEQTLGTQVDSKAIDSEIKQIRNRIVKLKEAKPSYFLSLFSSEKRKKRKSTEKNILDLESRILDLEKSKRKNFDAPHFVQKDNRDLIDSMGKKTLRYATKDVKRNINRTVSSGLKDIDQIYKEKQKANQEKRNQLQRDLADRSKNFSQQERNKMISEIEISKFEEKRDKILRRKELLEEARKKNGWANRTWAVYKENFKNPDVWRRRAIGTVVGATAVGTLSLLGPAGLATLLGSFTLNSVLAAFGIGGLTGMSTEVVNDYFTRKRNKKYNIDDGKIIAKQFIKQLFGAALAGGIGGALFLGARELAEQINLQLESNSSRDVLAKKSSADVVTPKVEETSKTVIPPDNNPEVESVPNDDSQAQDDGMYEEGDEPIEDSDAQYQYYAPIENDSGKKFVHGILERMQDTLQNGRMRDGRGKDLIQGILNGMDEAIHDSGEQVETDSMRSLVKKALRNSGGHK